MLKAGLIDLVIGRRDLTAVTAYLIGHLKHNKAMERGSKDLPPAVKSKHISAWQKVNLARHTGRPTAKYYIAHMTSRFLELHGDRWSGDDPAMIGGIAEFNGDTVIMIGQERGGTPEEKATSHDGKAYSEGYRKIVAPDENCVEVQDSRDYSCRLPERPVELRIRTSGIAFALARNLATMANLPTPMFPRSSGKAGAAVHSPWALRTAF